MVLKNKSMALIRVRRVPYSGILSFFQDVFFRNESLADYALRFLKMTSKGGFRASDWAVVIKELFKVSEVSSADERVIDEACFKYLGFHRDDVRMSSSRLRGKKPYKQLLLRDDLPSDVRLVIERVNKWNSAVASYYSIITKLRALGFIERTDGFYVKSDRFRLRLSQVIGLIEGFDSEVTGQ